MSDPFREGQPGHSPVLERLALRNPEATAIQEVERLSEDDRDARVGIALGDAAPIGCLAMLGYLTTIGLVIAWLVGPLTLAAVALGVAGIGAGHVYHVLARGAWKRRLVARLAWVDEKPFPITGVRGYLASARPMIDVRFRRPPLAATLAAGVRGHDPAAEVTQIDDQTFRILLRHDARDGTTPPPDAAALQRFIDEVLVPVDDDLGIESVTLGGRSPTPAVRT